MKDIIKDIASTLITVAVIITVGIAITGTWPFMVAVESGSMEPHMHRGDVIFLVSPERTKIVTWEEGKNMDYKSFGDYGDVIVYYPNGDKSRTPIIHRAMYWIEKGEKMPNGDPAPHSGYITKGDHNPIPDQPRLSMPVKPEWIVGVAKFRIPYVGYLRLIFG
ncbi:signal peptidase I [Archaeoglobus veneficus]|uniref:Peptidase S26B, signal peptidase n=1 Tax=Archaeoglobus veneficus (strain DSM 11195 / SNP6) TaxID=693661 RepID=F2KQH5_ARCVS|nr:signal peptidase I [Archaeoglobus veneficus]AEA47708.1 peptidase S26B, signal peptidase [Archaeoglobus veneficus SNP6]